MKFTPGEMAYEGPNELQLSNWTPVIGRGLYAAEMRGERPLKATYAVVDDALLSVSLKDGRKVSVPVSWYPRLAHAAPAERNDWRLIAGGRVVLWEALNLAVAVKAILEGTKSGESAASLRKWLSGRRPEKKKAG